MRRAIAACALCLACAGPRTHVGPVTGLCALDDRVLACSQAGVLDDALQPVAEPEFRVLQIAGAADATLWLCGGDPGHAGAVGRLAAGRLVSAQVARDLIYDLALGAHAIALACADGRVLLADPARLDAAREVRRHGAACRAVALAPDGALLASAGLDGVVLLGDAGSQAPRAILDHTAGVECLAFSGSGDVLASGARDGKVRLHSRDGRLLRTWLRLGAPVTALAFERETLLAGLRSGALLELALGQDEGILLHDFGEPIHALLVRPGAVIVGLTGRCASLHEGARGRAVSPELPAPAAGPGSRNRDSGPTPAG